MFKRTPMVFLAALLLPVALTAAPISPAADVEQATWSEHVAPILFNNCVSCHRPGQVAPMSLMSYQEARPWAKSIRKATSEGTMPPWFANPEHGDFVEDARLSEEELALLTKWVEDGAPAGDLAEAPEPPTFDSDWKMGEPDMVFTMEPFEVTDEMEDHYQWLEIENTLDEDRWIKAIEVRPSFMEAAHHNLTYLAPEGMTLDEVQGAGRLEMAYLGGWAPGVQPMIFPEGHGKKLPANSKILFQMHYHKTPGEGSGGIDQTSVGVLFHDGDVEKEVTTMWIVDPALDIPAGEANYESASSFTFEHDAVVFNFTPHMHLRGKAMRYTAVYPDGTEKILLDVDGYDFNWQLTYSPRDTMVMPAGTTVKVAAVFDNSAENPNNPDPSIVVNWGEKTTDEMMIGFMDYTYVNQEEMPTHSMPEHMRERMEQFQKLREQQKAAAAAAKSGGDD